MRLVLECHSQVFCFDEVDAYRVLQFRTFEGEINKPLVGFKVPRFAEQLDADLLWDFGLDERVSRIYDGQRILFLVRDWRDVVASMMKLKLNQSWLQTYALQTINTKIASDPAFVRQWARELEQLPRSEAPWASVGALYWKYKSAALLRYKSAGYPVLGIAYEQLVADPKAQLRRACDFLGISFEPTMLQHPHFAHREVFASGLTVGQTDPKRAIDSASVNQWSTLLDERAIEEGNKIVGDLPQQLAAHI